MTNSIEVWREVVRTLREALPEIDRALSQANIPISARSLKAFDIVRDTMLKVSDYKAFLASEAHGKFLVIIGNWYRDRYGDAVDADTDNAFTAMISIHDTPFLMRIPMTFKLPPDQSGLVWMGFPASVQAEENAIEWIESTGVVKGLSAIDRNKLQGTATETANLIRSIGFDLRALRYETNADVADLAGAVGSDLQASARHLCERSEAGLRSAGWDASQAMEKALKIYIRRKGQTPPHIHDLEELARQAETIGAAPAIDRAKLAVIPSKRNATNMRYGGEMMV